MDQSTYFISSLNNESCPLGVSEWATQTILSKNDVTQSPTNILGNLCGFFIHKWRSTTFPKAYFRIFKKKYHVDFFSTNDAPRRSRKTNFRISCGFFFHKWRSTIYPVCGFFFHNLQIGVKESHLWRLDSDDNPTYTEFIVRYPTVDIVMLVTGICWWLLLHVGNFFNLKIGHQHIKVVTNINSLPYQSPKSM